MEQPCATRLDVPELTLAERKESLDVSVMHEIFGIRLAAGQCPCRPVQGCHQLAGASLEAVAGQKTFEKGHHFSPWSKSLPGTKHNDGNPFLPRIWRAKLSRAVRPPIF